MNVQNTAILFFSRTAKTEARIKPLASTYRVSMSLADLAIRSVTDIAKQTNLPLFTITEKGQRGETFGARFATAFEDIFRLGFERVIAIGNDCLSISKADILHAAHHISENSCVLGPSTDGGAYLIGIHQNFFNYQSFVNICWQSAETFNSIQNYLKTQNCHFTTLATKTDIDTQSDWSKVLLSIPLFIKNQILLLLKAGKQPTITGNINTSLCYIWIEIKSLRAPPSYC